MFLLELLKVFPLFSPLNQLLLGFGQMILLCEFYSALMELFENFAVFGLLLLDSLDFLEFLLQLFLLLQDCFIGELDLLLFFHICHTHVF